MKITIFAMVAATIAMPAFAQWSYPIEKDAMRGTVTRWANTDSTNKLDFKFPYSGGVNATLVLRQVGKGASELILTVAKGQLLCHTNECPLAIKIDDGPVQRLEGHGTGADANRSAIFIQRPGPLIEKMKKAKRVIVEASFFREGSRQIFFNVQNLVWPQKGE